MSRYTLLHHELVLYSGYCCGWNDTVDAQSSSFSSRDSRLWTTVAIISNPEHFFMQKQPTSITSGSGCETTCCGEKTFPLRVTVVDSGRESFTRSSQGPSINSTTTIGRSRFTYRGSFLLSARSKCRQAVVCQGDESLICPRNMGLGKPATWD